MDNLMNLAWTTSFGAIVLGAICLIAYAISCLRKKTLERTKTFVVIVVIAYFLYIGLPYMKDYVGRETKSISGTVIDENRRTYRSRTTVYSYTLQAESGEQTVVHVVEKYHDTLGMEVGKQYEVSYFTHSKAVVDVTE